MSFNILAEETQTRGQIATAGWANIDFASMFCLWTYSGASVIKTELMGASGDADQTELIWRTSATVIFTVGCLFLLEFIYHFWWKQKESASVSSQ